MQVRTRLKAKQPQTVTEVTVALPESIPKAVRLFATRGAIIAAQNEWRREGKIPAVYKLDEAELARLAARAQKRGGGLTPAAVAKRAGRAAVEDAEALDALIDALGLDPKLAAALRAAVAKRAAK